MTVARCLSPPHKDPVEPLLRSRWATCITLLSICLLMAGCAGLPPSIPRQPTYALTEPDRTTLGRLSVHDAPSSPSPLSGFRLLPDAAFAFDARISLIRHAERTLDVQYYLIRNDDVGLLLLKELRDAAARGVRVRLLVDDLYASGEDALFSSFSSFPNVEVRLFNPLPSRAGALPVRLALSLFELARVNHRMHNKLLVADNSASVSGGRNIANDYFMRDTAANFIDVDVLSAGPIVRDMSATFDLFWNSDHVTPIEEIVSRPVKLSAARQRFDDIAQSAVPDVPLRSQDVFQQSPVGEQLAAGTLHLHWARARFYADRPEKLTRDHDEAFNGSVTQGALNDIAASARKVTVISPYFIPGAWGMDVLNRLIAAGGQVVVVTNSLGSTDEPLAYAGYERYRADLLKAGAMLYEVAPAGPSKTRNFGDFGQSLRRLHAKVAVMDDERVFIGSMNLDHRSASINTELGLLIESPRMAAELNSLIEAEHFELGYRLQLTPDGRRVQWIEHDELGDHVVHEDVPGDFLWLRLKNWLLLPFLGGEELL